MQTQGEYRKETEMMLMEDDKYPIWGYKPFDIRKRIKSLLDKEKDLKIERSLNKDLALEWVKLAHKHNSLSFKGISKVLRKCLFCGLLTSNPKFCDRSCAAKFNNKKRIK